MRITFRRILLIAVSLCVGLSISLLVPWKLNIFRQVVAHQLERSTGRVSSVEGDIYVYWLQGPRFTVDRLQIGNPPWASSPHLVSLEQLDARVSLPALLRSQLLIPEVAVDTVNLQLEEASDGRRNWYFDRLQRDSRSSPEIRRLTLKKGQIRYKALHTNSDVLVNVNAAPVHLAVPSDQDASDASLTMIAMGQWRGLALDLSVSGASVKNISQLHAPYPFRGQGTIGATTVAARGTVTGLVAPTAFDLNIKVNGQDLSDWLQIAGIGLPPTRPYTTEGRLRLDNDVLHYDKFTGRIGASDVAGTIAIEPRSTRPFITGAITSKRVDLADFGPVIGKSAGGKAGQSKSVASGPAKLLPQISFDSRKWGTVDAQVHFSGKSIINAGRLPFESLEMQIVLQDKLLSLQPLSFGVAGGTMSGTVRLDGAVTPIDATMDVRFKDLHLAQLTPQVSDAAKTALGRFNGVLKLKGSGSSVAAMLAAASGTAQFAMGRGEISSLLLEISGLQGPQIVRYLLGDRNAKVRCALGDFVVQRGLMNTKEALIDTDLSRIGIQGTINLASERLDLKIIPLPKERSVGVLRTPFYLTGPFTEPSIQPEDRTLAARIGGAWALGLLTPLAALLPLIETGPGEDAACTDLLRSLKQVPVKNTDRRR